jgi:hypothetical protein
MATFRNEQIEDILNNERKLNRIILDRTSAHIAAIGDEKAPSTYSLATPLIYNVCDPPQKKNKKKINARKLL